MYITVLILVCAISHLEATPLHSIEIPILDDKIVGGIDVRIEEYPYQLSLEYNGRHVCGASIIAPNKALTAAHCTYNRLKGRMTIRAGTSYKEFGGQVIPVKNVCQHPFYNPSIIDYDVSVLILSRNIKFSTSAQPIQLISKNVEVPVGSLGIVTGWGSSISGGPTTVNLKKVVLSKYDDLSCKRAHYSSVVTSNMICFGQPEGKRDSCQGDSGGPVVVNGKQVGIVSWGRGCALRGFPSVNAKISVLRNHIDQC